MKEVILFWVIRIRVVCDEDIDEFIVVEVGEDHVAVNVGVFVR